MSDDRTRSIAEIADDVIAASSGDEVSVGDIVEAMGRTSHHALLFIVAALAATPLSGVPGVSVVCGAMIAIISFEALLRYDEVRIPARVRRGSVDAAKLRAALEKAKPVIRFIDRFTRRRWEPLFHRPIIHLPLIVCMVSGAAMPFLEFIPFTSSIVAAGVALIAVALLTRDGLFAMLALLPYAGFAYLATRVM